MLVAFHSTPSTATKRVVRPSDLVGRDLGGYHIDSIAGRGGLGVVYLAQQRSLGRRVALKVLRTDLGDDADFRERFLRESRIAASIEHPNVLPVYDAGEADGLLYLAMRYVDGSDLRSVLARGRPSLYDALSYVKQAAAALDAAHARGLVHRDVKPANLLLDSEHLYLADFGLARHQTADERMTRIGLFAGTIEYASPEQIRNDPIGAESDLYSLGCVAYELLTGAPPFDGPNEHAVLRAHLEEPVQSILVRSPELPAALDDALHVALAKRPEYRFHSGRALAEALVAAAAGRRDVVTRPTVISASRVGMAPAVTQLPPVNAKHGTNWGRWIAYALVIGAALFYLPPLFLGRATPQVSPRASTALTSTTPPATATPTLTPQPTARRVLLRPDQVILPPHEFPYEGYTVSRDQAFGSTAWRRTFESAQGDFWTVTLDVYVFSPATRSTDRIAAETCDQTFTGVVPNTAREVPADVVGDAAKACRYTFTGFVDWYEYTTGTRNVMVVVSGSPRSTRITGTTGLNRLVALARQQLAIIDRVAPP